ncbi:MAG: hypothetical protein AAGA92_06175 [Planctomycetota bacterium]
MSHIQDYDADAMDYSGQSFTRTKAASSAKQRRPQMGRKRGKAPQSVNGIHRRRRRKMAW